MTCLKTVPHQLLSGNVESQNAEKFTKNSTCKCQRQCFILRAEVLKLIVCDITECASSLMHTMQVSSTRNY